MVIAAPAAPAARTEALERAGAEVVVCDGDPQARVAAALAELGRREITSVLLEGGPTLAGAFLDAGEVDELRLFIAPIVIGGAGARPLAGGEGAPRSPTRRRRCQWTGSARTATCWSARACGSGSGQAGMFTGIVREIGSVEELERSDGGASLRVRAALAAELAAGDSVSVGGACLTVAPRLTAPSRPT